MDVQKYKGITDENLSDYAEASILVLDKDVRTEISSHEQEGLVADARRDELSAKVSEFYSK